MTVAETDAALTPARLAACIDHAGLGPDMTRDDVARVCAEAVHYGFAAVFVPPAWLSFAAGRLTGSPVRLGAPIGFPHGDTLSEVKAFEAERALALGARELDMVMHVGALKSGARESVRADIAAVVAAGRREAGVVVKVILETGLLTDDEKRLACDLAAEAGADFVKTATGFGPGGATVADVALLRAAADGRLRIKAAGGIRDLATARAMLAAGAERLGSSGSAAIMAELGAAPPA